MAEAILFSSDLAMKKVLPQFYLEYVNENDFSPFMGGSDYPVHVRDAVGKGQGDHVFMSLLDALDPDQVAVNMQQAIGTGQLQTIHAADIRINLMRMTAMLNGPRIMQLRTPIDLFGALRPQILTGVQQRLRNDLLDAAKYPAGGDSPVIHRSLFGNGAATNPYSYWDTEIDKALKECKDTDGLTVAHILRLRSMAMNGGVFNPNYKLEKKLRPSKILMKNGIKEEKFVLLVTNRAFMQLTKDPLWRAYGPTRGVIESNMQPSIISGSRYRGDINGVMIYEFPELERNTYKNAGAEVDGVELDVVHSIFVGAQGWGMCFAGQSDFSSTYLDHGNVYELCHIEQRGQTMLKFESTNNPGTMVENGIIHSFTSAN